MTLLPRSAARRRIASFLYGGLVGASRAPEFYREMGVPDTIEGRYEMIVLHAALLLRRLRQGGAAHGALAQAVLDFMAADLDRSMRELGVGDISVARYMKRLGEGFYGRAAAYDEALGDGDGDGLKAALLRNVYDGTDPGGQILAAIAEYVRNRAQGLASQPIGAIAAGRVDWSSGDAP